MSAPLLFRSKKVDEDVRIARNLFSIAGDRGVSKFIDQSLHLRACVHFVADLELAETPRGDNSLGCFGKASGGWLVASILSQR